MKHDTGLKTAGGLLTACLAMIAIASAQTTYNWTNDAADNDFSNFNNWQINGGTTNPASFAGDWFYINLDGTDKAVISASPPVSVSAMARMRMGTTGGPTGELLVSGGSTVLGNQLQVGSDAPAKLEITGGYFEVTNSYLTIGQSSGSDGLLTMSGGTVLADRVTLGNAAGSQAALAISGGVFSVVSTTTSTTRGSLRMNSGDATIDIGGTAVVNCESFITGWFAGGGGAGTGLVTMSGGVLNVTGSQIPAPDTLPTLLFADGGEVAFEAGTWNVFGDEVATIEQAIDDGKLYHTEGNSLIEVAYDGMANETTVSIRAANDLEAWRITYYGLAENTGAAANDAVGTGGLQNLVAYGFGLDPTTATIDDLPSPVAGLGTITISFNEPMDVGAFVSYGFESSPDLKVWTPATDTPGGGFDHVFVAPAVLSKMFYRIRVNQL